MNRKPFLVELAELIVAHWPRFNLERRHWLGWLLPTPGNVLFTLLAVAGLLWATNAGALSLRAPAATGTSTGTIAYQGRLADSAGDPLTGTYNMIFRLYDVAAGGTPLWTEQWTGSNGVQVSDGLFNVMLGSIDNTLAESIEGRDQLWLGITVGTDDEMEPRVQLGSVPISFRALTVPDGSITTGKIADGAVTQAKLGADVSLVPPDGSITTAKIADGAVTRPKLGGGLFITKLAPEWMPFTVNGTRPNYWAELPMYFPEPFPNQCVFASVALYINGSHWPVAAPGPGCWKDYAFFKGQFYYDGDITSAAASYMAIGY